MIRSRSIQILDERIFEVRRDDDDDDDDETTTTMR
jgi:hypothetical protein